MEGRKVKQVLSWWESGVTSGRGRDIRKVCRKVNKGRGIMENDGGSEFKIHCKHFCKCHNVPPVQ
jgi:hypothetical protein